MRRFAVKLHASERKPGMWLDKLFVSERNKVHSIQSQRGIFEEIRHVTQFPSVISAEIKKRETIMLQTMQRNLLPIGIMLHTRETYEV